jgi:hypothetical protein
LNRLEWVSGKSIKINFIHYVCSSGIMLQEIVTSNNCKELKIKARYLKCSELLKVKIKVVQITFLRRLDGVFKTSNHKYRKNLHTTKIMF